MLIRYSLGAGNTTVNLTLALARLGHRAGILDTDIFGPSIPTLLNLSGEPRLSPRLSPSIPPIPPCLWQLSKGAIN